jgi:hypothetical protein
MADQGDHSREIRFGKFVGHLYPDVYFQFVSKLHKEHPDLLRAMELAQVTIADGSALDFLNLTLGTSIKKETPMELGYAMLLDALSMRKTSQIAQANMDRVAKEQFKDFNISHDPRPENEKGKGIFPSWDELEQGKKQ